MVFERRGTSLPSHNMIRELYNNIVIRNDIRKNLIELKKEIKEEDNKRAFLYLIGSDYTLFFDLLEEEDPKVRKNIALIMGELGKKDFLHPLFDAYKKEKQLFVKSAYLTAISNLNYLELLPELKNLLDDLTHEELVESSKKHVQEQIHILSDMIITMNRPQAHEFSGFHVMSKMILITNRDHKNITLNQIHNSVAEEMNAGVYVKTDDLHEILPIRTYHEILFHLDGVKLLDADPKGIAKGLLKGKLMDFMSKRHIGKAPFYFRIDIKNKMELDKKSAFAKKIASEIEIESNREFINTTSNYEFEIRLIENKSGMYHVLIKLHTIKDNRFSYRKNTVAASINPVNAALVVELARDYLVEDAQILDPFCGVGTMLIEREKLLHANPIYGVDIFAEAISKARENANIDKTIINFINRDFFDFKHDYKFDEIITNLFMKGIRKNENNNFLFYKKFFAQAKTVLKNEGIIILYTNEKPYVVKCLNDNTDYKLQKEYVINKKEGTYLFIIKYIES